MLVKLLITSGISVKVSGVRCQVSAPPQARKAVSQIGKETLKKRITNIEQGITNIEVGYSTCRELLCRTIIIIFEKRLSAPTPPKRLRRPRAIPHFIIRNFLFDILRFAVPTMGSFIQGVRNTDFGLAGFQTKMKKRFAFHSRR